MENTRKMYNSWNAIMRAPVYQAPIFIPIPHVSFNSCSVQKPHQIIRANNIMFIARSKLGVSLTSIIAIANSIICSNSFGNDIGIGSESEMSFIWIK